MQLALPEFVEGIHYKQLRGGSYRFELLCDVAIKLPELLEHIGKISFRDYKGVEWARIDDELFIARCGYAWNGASPKRWLPLIGWIGTPDYEPTRLATLYHDIMYGYCRVLYFPFTVAQCNTLFYNIMTKRGFKLAGVYHAAVRDLGEKYFAGEYPQKGEYSVLL